MAFFDFINSSFILSQLGLIDNIRCVHTNHGFIGRNNHYAEIINLLKFLFFSFSSTGHTGQLLIHTEVVLESDSSQSLAFTLNLDAFLSFDSLMQAFGEAATKHEAAGKFVNDNYLTIFNHIITVTMHQCFSLQSAHQLMREVHAVFIIIHIADTQHFFSFRNTNFCGRNLFLLFVNSIIFTLGHVGYHMRQYPV